MRFFDGENWRDISEDEARYRAQEGQLPVAAGVCGEDCKLADQFIAHTHNGGAPVMLIVDDVAAEVVPMDTATTEPAPASVATPISVIEPTTEPKPKQRGR